MSGEFELIESPLSRNVEMGGHVLEIAIYKGIDEKRWFLELVDEFNNVCVCDDTFETEAEALETALSDIKKRGIEYFIGEDGKDADEFTMTEEEYALDLVERLKATFPMTVTPSKALIHNMRQDERQKIKLRPKQKIRIDSCLYIGDEGGVACSYRLGDQVVISSITHLKLDPKHPLYREVKDYQLSRKTRLALEGRGLHTYRSNEFN